MSGTRHQTMYGRCELLFVRFTCELGDVRLRSLDEKATLSTQRLSSWNMKFRVAWILGMMTAL